MARWGKASALTSVQQAHGLQAVRRAPLVLHHEAAQLVVRDRRNHNACTRKAPRCQATNHWQGTDITQPGSE